MNFTSTATNLLRMAGGSIPGTAELNPSQIWGVTIAGLGIVFACLVLLVLVIWLFGKIFDGINQRKRAKAAEIAAQNAPKVSAKPVPAKPAPAPAAPAEDEDEVIAVISAVIAAMSEQDGKVYKLHSVKPAANTLGGRTAWAMDGRRQNVMPF